MGEHVTFEVDTTLPYGNQVRLRYSALLWVPAPPDAPGKTHMQMYLEAFDQSYSLKLMGFC